MSRSHRPRCWQLPDPEDIDPDFDDTDPTDPDSYFTWFPIERSRESEL